MIRSIVTWCNNSLLKFNISKHPAIVIIQREKVEQLDSYSYLGRLRSFSVFNRLLDSFNQISVVSALLLCSAVLWCAGVVASKPAKPAHLTSW